LSGASVKEKEVMTLTLGDHRTEHETLGSWREEKKNHFSDQNFNEKR
jgi:hypothetical protein